MMVRDDNKRPIFSPTCSHTHRGEPMSQSPSHPLGWVFLKMARGGGVGDYSPTPPPPRHLGVCVCALPRGCAPRVCLGPGGCLGCASGVRWCLGCASGVRWCLGYASGVRWCLGFASGVGGGASGLPRVCGGASGLCLGRAVVPLVCLKVCPGVPSPPPIHAPPHHNVTMSHIVPVGL